MNPIGVRMWSRGMTIKKWSQLNSFAYSTVQAVLRKKRGLWKAGVSRRIQDALVNQGLATADEFMEEVQ